MTHAHRAPMLRTHPLTGLPITPLGMSKRGPIWPILGGDDTVPPGTPAPPAGGAPATPPSPAGEPPAGGDTPPAPGDAKVDLTQKQLDDIVAKRLAEAEKKHAKALADLQATAGKSELEAAQIKAQQAEAAKTEVTKTSASRIAATEAKLAAHLAGARPDRLDAILKQADLTDAVSDTGDVDETKVKAAIDAVLVAYPEWKGEIPAPPPPGASGVPMGGGTPTTPTSFTREQIAKMTPEEYSKNREAIHKAMAEGRVKG